MENDVLIKVTGLQVIEETGDTIEMMARGKHYIRNNKHYLLYDEIEDEEQPKVKNIIKFNDEFAEITRQGMVNGKLIFEKGKNNQSLYGTPFGDLLVEVVTKNIDLKSNDDALNLKIDYELYANNSKVSDSKIEIDVRAN